MYQLANQIIFNQRQSKKHLIETNYERQKKVAQVEQFQLLHQVNNRALIQREKTKPISKSEKKRLSHSRLRIQKGKNQGLYLLKAQKQTDYSGEEWWRFQVFGASGQDYGVIIRQDVLSCGCADSYFKKTICKHIYFIITQVAKSQIVLIHVRKNTKKLSHEIYNILNNALNSRLQPLIKNEQDSKQKCAKQPKQNICEIKNDLLKVNQNDQIKSEQKADVMSDEDCMICFTSMQPLRNVLSECPRCRKCFHNVCLSLWKTKSSTCPYCRLQLNEDDIEIYT